MQYLEPDLHYFWRQQVPRESEQGNAHFLALGNATIGLTLLLAILRRQAGGTYWIERFSDPVLKMLPDLGPKD